MSRVTEEFTFVIEGHDVKVVNDGILAYKKWSEESVQALHEVLEEDIQDGKTKGFIPYANFEASITWNIVEK